MPATSGPPHHAEHDDHRRDAADHAERGAAEVVGADGRHQRPAHAPREPVQDREGEHHPERRREAPAPRAPTAWPSMQAAAIRRLLKRSPSQPPLSCPIACITVISATTRARLLQRVAEPLGDVDDHVDHAPPRRRAARRRGRAEMYQKARVAIAWRGGEVHARPARRGASAAPSRGRVAVGRRGRTPRGGGARAARAAVRPRGRARPEAKAVQRQPKRLSASDDQRREQAADRHAHAADAERERAAAAEPRDDGDADGQVAAEARADRHHEERQEEA